MNTRPRAVDLAEIVVDKLLAHRGLTRSDLARILDKPADVMDAVLRLLTWDGRAIPDGAAHDGEVRYRGRDTPIPNAEHQPDPHWGDGEWPVVLSFSAISAAGHVVTYSPSADWHCTCPEFSDDTDCSHMVPANLTWALDAPEPGELSVGTAALLEVLRHDQPVEIPALAERYGIDAARLVGCLVPLLRLGWLVATANDGMGYLAVGPAYLANVPLT
jgi:hypothetical protein